jgi:hypothetical protein
MKKKLIKLLLLGAILFSVSPTASAQIYVRIRPTFTVPQRPPRPSNLHIWVNEDWQPDGRSYRYSGGHWEAPPRRGYYRSQGYWKRTRQGQTWVKGQWRSRNKRR